jgi:translation initiation factor 3 subunit G
MQAAMQSADKSTIVGSLKDMLYKRRMERELLRAKGLLAEAERPPDEDGKPAGGLPSAPKPGSYVPPRCASFRERWWCMYDIYTIF